MSESEKLRVAFISYTKADWDSFVRPFTAALLGKRIDAQAFEWEKKPGRLRFLEDAVKADFFVPVLSAASVVSQGVLAEINVVNDRIVNRPETVIPVILGGLPLERFPAPLLNLYYVRKKDYEAAAAEVARLIRGEKHPEKPPLGPDFSITERPAMLPLSTFSLAKIRRLAAGNAEAQNHLGVIYAKGDGVPQDYAEAVKWFARAAEQNESLVVQAIAQYNLASLHHEGKGVARDPAKAVEWTRRAAEQGLSIAQYNFGVLHNTGEGVPQNHAEAMKWYILAAHAGHAKAEYNLGVMFYEGEGVFRNHAEAMKWFLRAAEKGVAAAQYNSGNGYDKGEGVSQDSATAARWYRRAAKQEYAKAQCNLGIMLYQGDGVRQNHKEAAMWFRRAAKQGDAQSAFNLGVMYKEGQGVRRNREKAVKWFRVAAKQGHAKARRELGCRDDYDIYIESSLAADRNVPNASKYRDSLAGRLPKDKLAAAQSEVARRREEIRRGREEGGK